MIRKYAEIFCWKNVSSFCWAKASHIFSAKNIRKLYIYLILQVFFVCAPVVFFVCAPVVFFVCAPMVLYMSFVFYIFVTHLSFYVAFPGISSRIYIRKQWNVHSCYFWISARVSLYLLKCFHGHFVKRLAFLITKVNSFAIINYGVMDL